MPPPAEHHLRPPDQPPRRRAEPRDPILADPDHRQPLDRPPAPLKGAMATRILILGGTAEARALAARLAARPGLAV